MPIRPDQMKLYPGGSIRSPEWLAIRERIRARAGDCCEECGVRNLAYGYRNRKSVFTDLELDRGVAELKYVAATYMTLPRDVQKFFRIVCTVAHRDNKLVDHSDANLAFWCQKCHLAHDHKQHQANAAITRHEKRGQPDLLGRD